VGHALDHVGAGTPVTADPHRFKGSRASDVLRPHKNLHLEHGPAELVALADVHSNPGVYKTHAKQKNEGAFLNVQSGAT
jgi:hypothetical protein